MQSTDVFVHDMEFSVWLQSRLASSIAVERRSFLANYLSLAAGTSGSHFCGRKGGNRARPQLLAMGDHALDKFVQCGEWRMVDIEVDADNRPTNGEQILERQLDQCKPEWQFPKSDNEHSSDNKRHYISWGGVWIANADARAVGGECYLLKPLWVKIMCHVRTKELKDVCTLCPGDKHCCDFHFQSQKHMRRVAAWWHQWHARCFHARCFSLYPCPVDLGVEAIGKRFP